MSNIDLLDAVQPRDGWFAIVGIKKGKVQQKLVATREEADELIFNHILRDADVYFGVAKYASNANRTKDNVAALKSLWVDIDCGKDKAVVNEKTGKPAGYIDKTTGISALQKFCTLTGLPKPLLVDSGRGIHAYWIFDKDVSREDWELIAERFYELCLIHGFYVDASVFEVARILRIPDTLNHKDNPPTPVSVINKKLPPAIDPLTLGTLLGVKPKEEVEPKRELTALGKSMQDSTTSSFDKIMRRKDGCKQLLKCFETQETLGYDPWCGVLSVVGKCSDAGTAIDKMCSKYPGYNKETALIKAATFEGAYTCKTFEKAAPGGCEGCPHIGKITSPIVLGKEFLAADPKDNEVVEYDEDGGEETHEIPEYPFPYYRGDKGGIYFRTKDEEADNIKVYQHDLYVVKIMTDPILGEMIVMKLHLPKDGVREFLMTVSSVADKRELKSILAKNGVVTSEKNFSFVLEFVIKSIQELQYKYRAEKMRLQFGWADKNSKFILGDREISVEGTYHSPPSSSTEKIAMDLNPVGDMEKWKEVFDLYGRKGLEPHCFAALTAFGAPLLKLFGQKGAIINVIHPKSGTGKTTVLHMCNSVYGNPEGLCSTWQDTMMAKIHRLGVMNNLPFCVDEITNMTPIEFSILAYSMSQGRGKDRMKASTNELRLNVTSWQTISLCSSNASFNEKLGHLKNNPDGELMRLLEYKIDNKGEIPTEVAKQMFDHQLLNNYGHAGEIYIKHILLNLEDLKIQALNVQKKIDIELKLTQRERFWSAVIAANITGGLIAKRLGLINWDMKEIYKWVLTMVLEMREDVRPPASNVASIIGDYVNRHVQNIVVVADTLDKRSQLPLLPVVEPRGELLIRYEPDTKRMFLAAKQFRTDCVDIQINYKETVKELKQKGILVGTGNKRLSKGMKMVSPAVHCIILDCSGADFIDLEDMTQPEEVVDE